MRRIERLIPLGQVALELAPGSPPVPPGDAGGRPARRPRGRRDQAGKVPRPVLDHRTATVLELSSLSLLEHERAQVADLAGLEVVNGNLGRAASSLRGRHVEARSGIMASSVNSPLSLGFSLWKLMKRWPRTLA